MASPKNGKSAGDLILVVASHLPEEWSEWDLTMAAWRAHPERFSLPGYPEHPDHKRVSAEMARTLRTKWPYYRRVRPNHYTIAESGRERLRRINAGIPATDGQAILLRASSHYALRLWERCPSKPEDVEIWEAYLQDVGSPARILREIESLPSSEKSRYSTLSDFLAAMDHRFSESEVGV